MHSSQLTGYMRTLSVSRMLTASASTPNTRQLIAKSVPVPANWHGVAGGMNAAKEAISRRDLDAAEHILKDVIAFAPSETSAWRLLARIQRKLGKIEAGIESATRALKLQNARQMPQTAASTTLARLLWQQGEKEHAIEMLALLLMRQPEDISLQTLKHEWERETDS